jgi:hypothetical protein
MFGTKIIAASAKKELITKSDNINGAKTGLNLNSIVIELARLIIFGKLAITDGF